jgi:RNA polymerase sigma-70 factor (ECF subfamily)
MFQRWESVTLYKRDTDVSVVGALKRGLGVATHSGLKAARMGNFYQLDRGESPVDDLRQLQAREAALAALVARAAEGDQMALAALYDATSALVYGLALRILRDQYAAEDVTSDVYTQVYRQVSRYDTKRGTPTAWLLTLTRSRAIDRLRQEAQRQKREEPLEKTTCRPSLTTGPEEGSATTEVRRLVRQALALLTSEQWQVIELAYYSGLSHNEIAATLGQPLGTVKTHIRTGMMLLREYLRPLLTEA